MVMNDPAVSVPTLMQMVRIYLQTAIAYWWVIVPGALMPLRDLLKLFKRLGKTPRWVELAVIFICFSIAQFLAYRNTVMNLYQVIGEKQHLSLEKNNLSAALEVLNARLSEVCFTPARHFSKDQKTLIYLALRDLEEKLPPAHKRVFIGSVLGDVEAQRFIQFFMSPVFANAAWNIEKVFDRPMRKKDADLNYPGNSNGVSISYTAEQGTAEYKWQNELTYGIIGAFHQANFDVNEGFVMKGDPLKSTNSLVIWVGPQEVTSQYHY
jgi:hypothetical protein